MGITRLNIYAGLLGLFLIRDDLESALNLPSGKYEIPLVIYDRMLSPDSQLYYPVSLKAGAPWVPEVYGDTIVVNGKIFPTSRWNPGSIDYAYSTAQMADSLPLPFPMASRSIKSGPIRACCLRRSC